MAVDNSNWRSQNVFIDADIRFDIRFCLRDDADQGDLKDAIVHPETINSFAEAISLSYRRLVARDGFCWPRLTAKEPTAVIVKDLGANRFGIAVKNERESYIVLNSVPTDGSLEAIENRRMSTVAHELCHLLQFTSPLFSHWNTSYLDPNWWLHEAIALVMEIDIFPDCPPSLSRFWNWATYPERSLESCAHGTMAAFFYRYLNNKFGKHFTASIYQTSDSLVPSMRGMYATEFQLNKIKRSILPDPNGHSVFLDYCSNAAFIGTSVDPVESKLFQVVGARSISEKIELTPNLNREIETTVDHLGCRYFELKSLISDSPNFELWLSVEPIQVENQTRQRQQLAASITCSESKTSKHFYLTRNSSGILTTKIDCRVLQSESLILTLSNCYFENGWHEHDDTKVRITLATKQL